MTGPFEVDRFGGGWGDRDDEEAPPPLLVVGTAFLGVSEDGACFLAIVDEEDGDAFLLAELLLVDFLPSVRFAVASPVCRTLLCFLSMAGRAEEEEEGG